MSPATEPLLGPKRQRELLNFVRAYGTGSVNELARLLGVSTSTVRRDLNELQERGLLERVHGGAAPVSDDVEPIRPLREVAYADEKRRIGQAAAAHVADHSTILVLGGTTFDDRPGGRLNGLGIHLACATGVDDGGVTAAFFTPWKTADERADVPDPRRRRWILLACLAGGVAIALQTRRPEGLLAGLAAGVMHMAWSAGFWRQWLARRPAAPQGATA